jgi:hypothetical protein
MSLERRRTGTFADQLATRVLGPLELRSVLDDSVAEALRPSDGLIATVGDLLHLAEVNIDPDQVPPLAEAIRHTQRVSSEVEAPLGSHAAHGWFHDPDRGVYWYRGSGSHQTFVGYSLAHDAAIAVVAPGSIAPDDLASAGLKLFDSLASATSL